MDVVLHFMALKCSFYVNVNESFYPLKDKNPVNCYTVTIFRFLYDVFSMFDVRI